MDQGLHLSKRVNEASYLIFTEKREVEQDLDGFGIGSHDDELADSSVESLRGWRIERDGIRLPFHLRYQEMKDSPSLAPFFNCL